MPDQPDMTDQTGQPTPPPADPADTLVPPGRTRDPGSRPAALLAITALVALFAAVFTIQQLSLGAEPPPDPEQIEAPGDLQFAIAARLLTRIAAASDEDQIRKMIAAEVQETAFEPADKLRLAVVNAELLGPDAALEQVNNAIDDIDKQRAPPETDDPAAESPSSDEPDADEPDPAAVSLAQVRADAEVLRTLYAEGPGQLTDAERDALATRYGWFGRLALTQSPDGSVPGTESERDQLLAGGFAAIYLLLGVGLLMLVVFITGCVLLAIAIVKAASGTLQRGFDPPAPGGSVYVELPAIFVGAFLLLQALSILIVALGVPPESAETAGLALQWSMVLVLLYPVLRGVPFSRVRKDLGLTTGAGVIKEVGAGILAYLATFPLLVSAAIATFVLIAIKTAIQQQLAGPDAQPEVPANNPLFEIITGSSPLTLALLVTLAVFWAPLMEETVFRGGLFRHMRSRVAWPIAAVGTALVFAGLHGYAAIQLLPILTLGFCFAAMREWRGSLIAPMTAHFIHNASVLAIVIILVRVLAA